MIDLCATAFAVSGPRGRACRAFGPDFTQGIWVSDDPRARLPTVELPPGATGPVRRRRARTCFRKSVPRAHQPTAALRTQPDHYAVCAAAWEINPSSASVTWGRGNTDRRGRLESGPASGRHFRILVTRPAPTVRPPSRIANLRPSSIAIGWISWTVMLVLSPGMTISVPSGSVTTPVTSVVRK